MRIPPQRMLCGVHQYIPAHNSGNSGRAPTSRTLNTCQWEAEQVDTSSANSKQDSRNKKWPSTMRTAGLPDAMLAVS